MVSSTGEPYFASRSRSELPWLPPQTLVAVAAQEELPQTLTVVAPERVSAPVQAPAYVAPVRVPKPYRN